MANRTSTANKRDVVQAFSIINATRSTSGDGTALAAAPGAGTRNCLKDLLIWLIDPATSVTVTLKLGDQTLPDIKLDSTRSTISIGYGKDDEFVCSANGAIYAALSGNVAVGCFGRYYTEPT